MMRPSRARGVRGPTRRSHRSPRRDRRCVSAGPQRGSPHRCGGPHRRSSSSASSLALRFMLARPGALVRSSEMFALPACRRPPMTRSIPAGLTLDGDCDWVLIEGVKAYGGTTSVNFEGRCGVMSHQILYEHVPSPGDSFTTFRVLWEPYTNRVALRFRNATEAANGLVGSPAETVRYPRYTSAKRISVGQRGAAGGERETRGPRRGRQRMTEI